MDDRKHNDELLLSLAPIVDTMQSWIDGEPVWPYAKIIETWGQDFEMYRLRWRREHAMRMATAEETGRITFKGADVERTLSRGMALMGLRSIWIARFGFAIPCAELLDACAEHAPIVEVGAGTGYMTKLMRNRGIDVVGGDADWRGQNGHGFETGSLDELQMNGVQAKTMVRQHPDRTVFCSWPAYQATWFRQALKAMKIRQKIIVITEDACAEETAWQYLGDHFDQLGYINIPTFEHMNDHGLVCIKRR